MSVNELKDKKLLNTSKRKPCQSTKQLNSIASRPTHLTLTLSIAYVLKVFATPLNPISNWPVKTKQQSKAN